MAVGVLVSTRPGERLAVRLVLGFRPLSAGQRQLLEPVSAAALQRCGLLPGVVDWSVQPGRQANACATGQRTVAVTQGALDSSWQHVCPLTCSPPCSCTSWAITRPARAGAGSPPAGTRRLDGWRSGWSCFLSRLACGGRRPGRVTRSVVAVGGAVAIVQAAQQRQWLSMAILSAVAFALVVTPLLDGLVSRASEHAGDRYAASVGAGPDLARALQLLAAPTGSRRGVADRLLDRHPSVDGRLARLEHAVVLSR